MAPVSPFQFLLVLSLAPKLVPGSLKQHFLKYILEPPPCRTKPDDCTKFCTEQEECPQELQCCSAFCGIICTKNKIPKRKKNKNKKLKIIHA